MRLLFSVISAESSSLSSLFTSLLLLLLVLREESRSFKLLLIARLFIPNEHGALESSVPFSADCFSCSGSAR